MALFAVLAALSAIVLYAPGIAAPYYLDDFVVLGNAEKLVTTRFLGYASFSFSHLLTNYLGVIFPWEVTIYYRIPNVVIHVLASCAVFWLAREILGRRLSAGFAGALFLVHPIQTQAVTYISQRFESQAALFMFISAASYFRFRRGKSGYWLVGTVLAALAAAATKETAIALPLWLILIEILFFSGMPSLKQLAYSLPVVAAVGFPAWLAFKGAGGTLIWIPFERYLLSQASVMLQYLRLVFLPGKQFLLYDFPPAPGLTAQVAAQWLLLFALVGTALYLGRRRPPVVFGILTFFVMLSPTSVIPLPDLIFEHRLYPALAGFAIAIAAVLPPTRKMVAAFTVVFLFLGYRTYVRNGEWNNRVKFFEAHRAAFPNEARILASLGTAYAVQGEVKKAIEANEQAKKHLNDLNAFYYKFGVMIVDLNLATLYTQMGNQVGAMEEARRVLSVEPEQPIALRILFRTQFESGAIEAARKTLLKAIALDPVDVDLRGYMREVQAKLGNTEEVRKLDLQIEELQTRQERLTRAAEGRTEPEFLTPILFGTLFFSMMSSFLIFLVFRNHAPELLRWARTGSTISVDSAPGNLQDR